MIKKKLKKSSKSFNQKIICIILIVLAIGIISSIFPGGNKITGSSIFYNEVIYNFFYTFDRIIETVFPSFPQHSLIIYERFVLFLLLFAVLSTAAKALNYKGMTNVIVTGAISLIAVWFMPEEVLIMIGATYSTVFAAALILVPILIVSWIAWKIPGTKGGCFAKSIIFFVLLVVLASTKENIWGIGYVGEWFTTFTDTFILILFILAIYYLIRALTIDPSENVRIMTEWHKEQQKGILTPVIINEINKGINRSVKNYGGRGPSRGWW